MQRAILPVLSAALFLGACGGDVRETPLAAIDLTSGVVVEKILGDLPKQDKAAFLTFTIHHLATSKAFCGDVLVDKQGREPETVGDAIRMTLAREAERNRKPEVVDPATLTPVERYHTQLHQLLAEREDLVDNREMLLMLSESDDADRLAELEKQIEASAEELTKLRASAPPGAQAF